MSTQWQPIETAPKDGEHILAVNLHLSRFPSIIAYNVWEGCWADHPAPPEMAPVRRVVHQPTHWMPLPDPPSGKGQAA